MLGLIGKKLGMTSIYNDEGKNVPCTIVEAGPCYVTQIKNEESDGYNAVQLAFGDKREKNTNKAQSGHFKKTGVSPKRKLKEFRDYDDQVAEGATIDVSIFEEGDVVNVTGTSKGKGFQGVVKRHGFAGVGQRTHGQHNRERAPGAIGAASYPARVFKGMRMAGRTGNDRVKVKNLRVLKIFKDRNVLLISGAVPGAKGSFVIIEK